MWKKMLMSSRLRRVTAACLLGLVFLTFSQFMRGEEGLTSPSRSSAALDRNVPERILVCSRTRLSLTQTNRSRLWLCPLERNFTHEEETLLKQYIHQGVLVPSPEEDSSTPSSSDSTTRRKEDRHRRRRVGRPPESMHALYEGQWSPAPEPLLRPVGIDEVEAVSEAAACLYKSGTVMSTDHNRKFRVEACTIVRNRVKLLVEWIQYHRILGVEFFHIFDDDSTDGLRKALEPFVREGIVRLEPIPPPPYKFLGLNSHGSPQLGAMGLCVEAAQAREAAAPHRGHIWQLMTDTDEFVLPEVCLADVIHQTMSAVGDTARVGAVALGWSYVGCFVDRASEIPVDVFRTQFERTSYGLGMLDPHYKSIVKVSAVVPFDAVIGINPHQFRLRSPADTFYQTGAAAESIRRAKADAAYRRGDAILLHYVRRSTASFLQRYVDGRSDATNDDGTVSRPIENMTLTDLLVETCYREDANGGTPAGVLWYKFQQIHRLLLHGLGFSQDQARLKAAIALPTPEEKAHFPNASVVRTLWTTHTKSKDHREAFIRR